MGLRSSNLHIFKWKTQFVKDNMSRDIDLIGFWIKTSITLMMRDVTYEDTLKTTRREFIGDIRTKMGIARRTENSKRRIRRRTTIETGMRCFPIKGGCWKKVYEIDRC
jgi:hypothetical protein